MTYRQHWYRGGLILVVVAFAGIGTALSGAFVSELLVVLPLKSLGMHLSENVCEALGAVLSIIAFAPLAISQGLHRDLQPSVPGRSV